MTSEFDLYLDESLENYADFDRLDDDLDQEDLEAFRPHRCTPEQARQRLVAGNQSFLRGVHEHEMHSVERREDLVRDGQHPFAVIVTCADSRVQPVVSFSMGFGDLFVVRSIGNYIGRTEEAGVEYAVGHLGAPLVVVLGHTHCGLVHAAMTGHADGVTKVIADEVAAIIDGEKDASEAEKKHVMHGVQALLGNRIIADLVQHGETQVVGAIYHIGSGRVEWL